MMINTKKINDGYMYLTGKLLSVVQIIADELADRGYTVTYTIYNGDRFVESRKNKEWLMENGEPYPKGG